MRNVSVSDTEARILATATKLFAQKGYAATSTKEICRGAAVNIAAVHYHFKTKENLYRRIVSDFGRQGLEKISRILRPPATVDELRVRLEIFLESIAELIVDQPDVAHIILRDVDIMTSLCRDIFMSTFCRVHSRLVVFLKGAKRKGIVRDDADPSLVAHLLVGRFAHQHQNDREIRALLGLGDLADAAYRSRCARETVRLLLSGIENR